MTALVELQDIRKSYALPRAAPLAPQRHVRAVNGVSLCIEAGESLGVVGESGCGKSTLARLVMALEKPDAGHVRFAGRDLNALPTRSCAPPAAISRWCSKTLMVRWIRD